MADPMEMSLDDIIKTNRSNRGRRGRGRGGQTRGNNRSPAFKAQGGNMRRGGGGGAGAGRQQGRGGARGGAPAQVPSNGHIIISNLDFQVSDGDLNELFGEFGQIKKARVHFDAAGKSQGSADVVFARYQDAVRALQKYNGVPLDGREMRIMIASTDAAQPFSPQRTRYSPGRGGQRSGYAGRSNAATRGSGGGARGGRFQRGGGGRRGGRGRGGTQQRSMTREQLDAEIDAYHTAAQPMDS